MDERKTEVPVQKEVKKFFSWKKYAGGIFAIVIFLVLVFFLTSASFLGTSQDTGFKDGVSSSESDYYIEGENVFFNGKLVEGADSETFTPLGRMWAKDKNGFYRRSSLQKEFGFDFETLAISDSGNEEYPDFIYIKDKTSVWAYGGGYPDFIELPANSNEFTTLGSGSDFYGKDNRSVFIWRNLIEGADPTTFTLFKDNSGEILPYTKDKERAYFRGKILNGADSTSFEIINRLYAKDDSHVWYWGGNVMENADSGTFELIDSIESKDYSRDEDGVFYQGWSIRDVDLETFSIIGGAFSKDINNVYYLAKILQGADPTTFAIEDRFIKDKNNVWVFDDAGNTRMVENADPNTFEFVGICGSFKAYYKDKSHVFVGDKLRVGIRSSSFEFLGNFPVELGFPRTTSYAKDSTNVYVGCGSVLEGADVLSFEVLGEGYAKDSTSVWFGDGLLLGADPDTFVIFNSGYSKDKNNVFYWRDVIEQADPATFEVGAGERARDQKSIFDYGKPVEGQ